ncbi:MULTISPECIES: hypothetical protein [unclassified Serratia (in: enterobacteria)]|nr:MULTISPECIES: hypothetical protein [unclassified Serratia (in: enterobacteria)]
MQSKLDLNLARILCEVIDAGSVSAAAMNLQTLTLICYATPAVTRWQTR